MSRENDLSTVELSSDHAGFQKETTGMIIGHNETNKIKEKESNTEDKETTETMEEIDVLIDALHLQMLQLIEEQIEQNRALETHTSRARLLLARTRLQQGTFRTTASTYLPGFTPYRALCRLVEQGVSWTSTLKLLRFGVDSSKGFFEPVTHIFGSLVPYSLRLASRKWERCVDQIVECVNVQRELESVVRSIERLKWARQRRRNV